MGPGDHHRRVGRTLRRVLLDDDPGHEPRLQAGHHLGRADLGLTGQRCHLDGDRAVPGQRLVRAVESVLDRLTARPGRRRRTCGPLHELLTLLARNTNAIIATIATMIAITQPRADSAELGQLGVHQVPETLASRSCRRPVWCHGPRRHDVASARNSTDSCVSSM